MFTRIFLTTILCTNLIFALHAKSPYDRYDRYQKRTDEQASDSPQENKSLHAMPHYRASNESDDHLLEALREHSQYEEDEINLSHSPLGAILLRLSQSCSDFAVFAEKRDQQSLLVFCNVMELMSDLADQEWGGVHGSKYMDGIVEVVTSLRNAFNDDMRHNPALASKYPLLQTLVTAQEYSNLETDQFDLDAGMYLRNVLSVPQTSQALIKELFNELHEYTAQKIHAVLAIFQGDTRQLLDLTMHAPDQTRSGQHNYRTDETGRAMRQRTWLCDHAASACLDLADTIPTSTSLAQAGPLMQQIQAVLKTMSLTYDSLSAEPSSIRKGSQHELASQFASMIDLLPATSPKRTSDDSPSAFLDKCTTLKTPQAKQMFVEQAFASTTERDALLSEFFPALERSLEFNLGMFSNTLTNYTAETLAKHFWSTPSMKDLNEQSPSHTE